MTQQTVQSLTELFTQNYQGDTHINPMSRVKWRPCALAPREWQLCHDALCRVCRCINKKKTCLIHFRLYLRIMTRGNVIHCYSSHCHCLLHSGYVIIQKTVPLSVTKQRLTSFHRDNNIVSISMEQRCFDGNQRSIDIF